jgi:hypothetical protein
MESKMYDKSKIIPGLIIFLALVTSPLWYNAASGKTSYAPKLELPVDKDKKECVEPKAFIGSTTLLRWRIS